MFYCNILKLIPCYACVYQITNEECKLDFLHLMIEKAILNNTFGNLCINFIKTSKNATYYDCGYLYDMQQFQFLLKHSFPIQYKQLDKYLLLT